MECACKVEGHLFDCPDRIAALTAENERLRKLLKQTEWRNLEEWRNCWECGGIKTQGHKPDCELAAALKEEPTK